MMENKLKRVWQTSFVAKGVLTFGVLFFASALMFLGVAITGVINTMHSPVWNPPEPFADITFWSMIGSLLLCLTLIVVNVLMVNSRRK